MKTCPKVCSDIQLNLKNRDWAFKNVGYGPANPEEPEDFWDKRAEEWNTSPENAQTMKCGNCSAFIQTKEMMKCIVDGIAGKEDDDDYAADVVASGKLGFCALLDFKCAADRTCSAWIVNGPITKVMTQKQKNMVKMAKYNVEQEYGSAYDEEDEED